MHRENLPQRTLFAGTIPFNEIGELVDETMLVSNVQSGNPPFVHIRMLSSVSDMDGSPPPSLRIFFVIFEVIEAMQIVQIPEKGTVRTIDFEGVECLVSTSVTGGLENGQRPRWQISPGMHKRRQW